MLGEFIAIGIGLFVGVLTGFFFEHRATVAAKELNAELRRQLETLETLVYSLGGDPRGQAEAQGPLELGEALRDRATRTQDAAGRVPKRALEAHFIARGASEGDVENAINEMVGRGEAEVAGSWLEIR